LDGGEIFCLSGVLVRVADIEFETTFGTELVTVARNKPAAVTKESLIADVLYKQLEAQA
jgi:hypothetical protein